jgi:MinD superfamily P-loop ATPase
MHIAVTHGMIIDIHSLRSSNHIPAMVCINVFDLNPDEGEAIEAFAKQRNIKVMGRVPFDPTFMRAMVQGKTIVEFDGRSKGCEAVKNIWENRVQDLEI